VARGIRVATRARARSLNVPSAQAHTQNFQINFNQKFICPQRECFQTRASEIETETEYETEYETETDTARA
jgi:hypothetical protein